MLLHSQALILPSVRTACKDSAVSFQQQPQHQHQSTKKQPTMTTTTTRPQQSEESLLLTTELLLHRLHSGLGIAGGARGSLTKAASKRSVTDLKLQQLELIKLLFTSQRQAAELTALEQAAQAQRQQQAEKTSSTPSVKSIPELRTELARLEQVQSCLQEYEALAKLTVGRHAVSEHQLQQDIRAMEVQHARAVQELQQLTAACHVRQNQFHALQQCLQDLQQSLQEQPLTLHPHELARVQAAAAENSAASTEDDDDVMDVDEGEAKPQQGDTTTTMEEDEGELLYGDL